MRIVLLGPPGCGKGTQAALLSKECGIPHIAAGDLLREAVASETALGKRAKAYMDAGELVPDDLVVAMMKDRLDEEDTRKGYILDGFPRTLRQAELMEGFAPLDAAVCLMVPEEVLLERFAGRRVCSKCEAVYHVTGNPPAVEDVCDACGGDLDTREDDREEVVRTRLKVYREQTEPLLARYRQASMLIEVDAAAGIQETHRRLMEATSRLASPEEG